MLKSKHLIDEDDPRVCQIGHPAPPWLVNYADLMTELVCFFVILYALSAVLSKSVQKTFGEMQKVMQSENIAGEVKITKEGLRISLEESGGLAFFESGSSELSEGMKKNLDILSPNFKELVNKLPKVTILVEGHTDNIPISTSKYSSNWELSTARAINVIKYLINTFQLPPSLLTAVGYGEYRPIVANDSPENCSRNRRIVFLIKTSSSDS